MLYSTVCFVNNNRHYYFLVVLVVFNSIYLYNIYSPNYNNNINEQLIDGLVYIHPNVLILFYISVFYFILSFFFKTLIKVSFLKFNFFFKNKKLFLTPTIALITGSY